MLDFSIIDCHNHSIPYIDDGAENMDMALAMLQIASDSGTSDVILTPHHLNGAFSNGAEHVLKHFNALVLETSKNNISINLHYGSEVHLVSETVEHIVSQKALTYCGLGKAALIELPKNSIPNGVERILSELIYNGISPIIAHPERNSALRRDQTPLMEWIEFGCKSQLTGQSCTGEFGTELQEISFKMIEQGLVHIVASDAHRPTGRTPDLSRAAEVLIELFDIETAKMFLHDNPKRLIDGQDLLSYKPQCNRPETGTNQKKHQQTKKTPKRKKTILQRLIEFR